MREELIVCEEKENISNRRVYINGPVGITNGLTRSELEDLVEQNKYVPIYDSRRIKVIKDEEDEVCPDIIIDETPEEAQADLKKKDPDEDKIEKTLASYGIVLDYVYDFPANKK